MIFSWKLSDNEFPQVFITLLSILADLNNAVVWMISARPLIQLFLTPPPATKPLGIVPSAPTTIDVTVKFMFHSFFRSLANFNDLFLFSFFNWFSLYGPLGRQSPLFGKFSFFVNNYFTLFHTSVRWWFSTRVRVTASRPKSPGLFSVLWPISILLLFGWSLLVLLLPSPPVFVPILWWLYRALTRALADGFPLEFEWQQVALSF